MSQKLYNIVNKMISKPYRGEMRCRHLAIAIKNGKPVSKMYYNYIHRTMFHAETNLINHKGFRKVSNITILVIRISKSGKLLYSKPCIICIQDIKKFGFRKVCYSTGNEDEPFITEKINRISSTHYTVSFRSQLQTS